MARTRVYELAKALGVESVAIMTIAGQLKAPVRSASSELAPSIVRAIMDEVSKNPPPARSRTPPATRPGLARNRSADRPNPRAAA